MKFWSYILGGLLIWSCSSGKVYTEQDRQAYDQLKTLVAEKHFEIVFHSARPMASNAMMQLGNSNILGPGNTTSNIQIGTSNRLTIDGDSIRADLPFYGEQHSGGAYESNHQGIAFMDVPDLYNVQEHDAKQSVVIDFRIRDQYRGNEHYTVSVTLYPNRVASARVQSSNRSSITFSGNLRPLISDAERE